MTNQQIDLMLVTVDIEHLKSIARGAKHLKEEVAYFGGDAKEQETFQCLNLHLDAIIARCDEACKAKDEQRRKI